MIEIFVLLTVTDRALAYSDTLDNRVAQRPTSCGGKSVHIVLVQTTFSGSAKMAEVGVVDQFDIRHDMGLRNYHLLHLGL